MKRDLKLNMSHLDAISRKVQSYIDAMEAVGLAARKFEQTIKDQDSDAYNKLSEQWETNVWENETAMMRVDRNDIWWNYKQIEGEATSFDWIVQDTGSTPATYKRLFIPNPFSSDEENEAKKSAQQQEEDAGNAIKDFMTGVWDSLAGTVMGLLTLVVDLGTLYVDVRWKSVVPIQVPEVLDQEVEKIKQKYEPRLKDPVNTIGGIGQSICDTADEKGVAYSS